MKQIIFPLIAVLLISSQQANSSPANLIHISNYTADNLSGLQWLDLSVTIGRSYNDVSTDTDLFENGWHYASASEFDQLATNYALNYDLNDLRDPSEIWNGATEDFFIAKGLLDLLGKTYTYIPPSSATYELRYSTYYSKVITSDIVDTESGTHNTGYFGYSKSSVRGYATTVGAIFEVNGSINSFDESIPDLISNHQVASLLVRDSPSPVPLPSAISFFIAGLLGLNVFFKKRC